jgi:hypothetical protein
MTLEAIVRVLTAIGAQHALIGAHAMAARGYPRFTVDVDVLTTNERVLSPDVWSELAKAGATVDCRRGDADDPLRGVVHVLLADGTDVDVVVGKWKWEANVIERAEEMTISGVAICVPRTSDLILLKLAAGGFGDLQDAAALLALGNQTLVDEVARHVADVKPDVRNAWRRLLAERAH